MIATVAFAALLFAASCCDVLRLRIPNVIPAGLVVLFALQILLGGGVQAPLDHLLAMGLALLILLPLFALDMLGGGDVKLLVAVALWLGMSKLAALLRGDYPQARSLLLRAIDASPDFYEPATSNLRFLKSLEQRQAPAQEAP